MLIRFIALALSGVNSGFAVTSMCPLPDIGAFQWAGAVTLDPRVNFMVQWRLENDELFLGLSAATTGCVISVRCHKAEFRCSTADDGRYVAIGFGEPTSGSMLGADIVTASVSDAGAIQIDDRYVPFVAFPFELNETGGCEQSPCTPTPFP
jgi:hypothetical protein